MSKDKSQNHLRPFEFHGLDLVPSSGDEYVSDCLFCDKESHLFVNSNTGQWGCKKCGKSGNVYTFLEAVVDKYRDSTTDKDYNALSVMRDGLPVAAIRAAGMVKDDQGRWLLPVRNAKGTVTDIRWTLPREYTRKGSDRVRYDCSFKSTPEMHLTLWGMEVLAQPARSSEPVFTCEGEWDGIIFMWLLRLLKREGVVVAVPGASSFKDKWVELFQGRRVFLLYDNDRAGDDGSMKVGRLLNGVVRTLYYIHWPDHRPEGYDIRDLVTFQAVKKKRPKSTIKAILDLCRTHHRREEAVAGEANVEGGKPKGPPPTFPTLLKSFRKHIKMTPDMVDGLKVSLAVACSNFLSGDPVWLFLVGPPGCGKTLILTSLADSINAVYVSTLSAHTLISGFQGAEDPSLIPKLNGKVFIFKDYTEILSKPSVEMDEIFSTLRGAFDGEASRPFGNGVTRKYKCHFSMLAGVTSAIHGNSKATLGERFLKFHIFKGVDLDVDDQIRSAVSSINKEARIEQAIKPIVSAFLDLRDYKRLSTKVEGMMTPWAVERIVALAQIIAMLRAEVERNKWSDEIMYRPQYEVGTRLAKQLVKLALGLAIVDGKKKIDEDVYRLVERVAFDTAIGFHLDIIQALMSKGGSGDRESVAEVSGVPMSTLSRIMDDLCMLRVLRKEVVKTRTLRGNKNVYHVSKKIRQLWQRAKVSVAPKKRILRHVKAKS